MKIASKKSFSGVKQAKNSKRKHVKLIDAQTMRHWACMFGLCTKRMLNNRFQPLVCDS